MAAPALRAGHKCLFFDRLDVGVSSGGVDTPQIVPEAFGLYHNRNRVYNPALGRFMQRDPNALASMIFMQTDFHGLAAKPLIDGFDMRRHFRDGANAYAYLHANAWTGSDPLGLYDEEGEDGYDGEDLLEDASDIMGLLDPMPGPSDFVRESLNAAVEDYAANLEWDVDWALDWSLPDDDHSRGDNTWVGVAFARGMHNAFELGLPGSDKTVNPTDWFAKIKRDGGGTGRTPGVNVGHTIHTKKGQGAHQNYRLAVGPGYKFEQRIPGARVDAINFEARVVRELKPDTPSGRAKGAKQLARYIRVLEKETGQKWTGFLDFYRP